MFAFAGSGDRQATGEDGKLEAVGAGGRTHAATETAGAAAPMGTASSDG
jgi:hypothetical protein